MDRWVRYERKVTDNYTKAPPARMQQKPSILNDYLSVDDWSVITELRNILQPLKAATIALQGHGSGASFGVIWQVIPSMEKLLTHFEQLRQIHRPTESYSHLAYHVNLGWQKLDKYYNLTDRAPVYVAAVVLHPHYTWQYLKSKWKDRPAWLSEAEEAIQRLWQEYSSKEVPADKPDAFDSNFSDCQQLSNNTGDEYEQWCQRRRVPGVKQPLTFWSNPEQRRLFPRLSTLALDLFTIPAMSDEPERTFSATGAMVTPLRGRIHPDLIHKAQCLRSWSRGGVINYQGLFGSLPTQPILIAE